MRAKQFLKKLKEAVGDGDVANAVVAEVIKLIGEGHTEVSPDVITTKVSAVLGRPFMLKDLVAANNSSPELQHYIDTINPSKIKFSTDILTVKNEDPMKAKEQAQSGVANMASRAASRDRSLAEHADDPKLEKRLSKTVPGYNKSMDRAQGYAKDAHKAQTKSKSVKEGRRGTPGFSAFKDAMRKSGQAGSYSHGGHQIPKKKAGPSIADLNPAFAKQLETQFPGAKIVPTKYDPENICDIKYNGENVGECSRDENGRWDGTIYNDYARSNPDNLGEEKRGISKDAETKFHKELDTLVHDTFGKRKEEMKEGVTSPAIKQAYQDIFKTEPQTPERKAAVEHYQSLRKQEMAKKSVKEAKARPTTMQNDFYVYDPKTKAIKKKFRKSSSASDYAEKNGLKSCSSEYYADKISKSLAEGWEADLARKNRERMKAERGAASAAAKMASGRAISGSVKKPAVDLGRVMMAIDMAIGDSFPDGDPIDRLQKYMGNYGDSSLLDKAVRKYTKSKSYSDYVAANWQQHIDDNPEFDQQNPWTESINENAEELNIGDEVQITGPVEYQGSVGVIYDFGRDKRFVVVEIPGEGRHSFHSSDVEAHDGDEVDEAINWPKEVPTDADRERDANFDDEENDPHPYTPVNEYDEEDDYEEEEDEGFFVFIGDEENGGFIGMLVKEDGKWRERTYKGNAPHNWGGTYMGYLTPQDVMNWIYKDYGRQYEDIRGPMSEDEANEYMDYMSEGQLNELSPQTLKTYIQHAYNNKALNVADYLDHKKTRGQSIGKIAKRDMGINKAIKKMPAEYEPESIHEVDGQLNELSTHYDQVKYQGKLLTLDRWPDGHLTISAGTRVLKSGPFNKIKPVWDKLKGEQVAEGWESGPDERAPRERDPDAEYDAHRQAKADSAANAGPKKTTYKLYGRGPNGEANYDFGLGEFDSQEAAAAARDRLIADSGTPNPRDISIQTIRRSVTEGVDLIRKLAGL